MSEANQPAPYSLRLPERLKARAKQQAALNRRSLNAELGVLIEEGLMLREQQSKRVHA